MMVNTKEPSAITKRLDLRPLSKFIPPESPAIQREVGLEDSILCSRGARLDGDTKDIRRIRGRETYILGRHQSIQDKIK
jgi:hypothetical protein